MSELKPWKILSSRELLSIPPWLRVSSDRVQLPDDRIIDDFYQIKTPEYAVVFAQTTDGLILMERHYKHGVGEVILSLPAGYLEPDENPLDGAKRELREETGYEANEWHSLGAYVVNGNQGCGKAHLFLATGANLTSEIHIDDLEETEILMMNPDEVVKALSDGDIATLSHAATIALAINTEFFKQ